LIDDAATIYRKLAAIDNAGHESMPPLVAPTDFSWCCMILSCQKKKQAARRARMT